MLSGNKDIRYLNKKFRKKDKATDILSFPFQTKKELKKKIKTEKDIYLGDIIINLNKIKNKGINTNANGIRILKLSSKVNELVTQNIPLK